MAVADMYEPAHRARAVGILLAAGTVGAVGSPFLVAFLRSWAETEALDANVVPWIVVPAAAVGALACSLSLRPDPRELAITSDEAPAGPAGRRGTSWRCRRSGRRPGLIAGGIASIAGSLLAATDVPGPVGIGLFAIGLGWSATFLGATAVISDHTRPEERGAALGLSDLVVAVSSAAAALAGGLVFESAGFRVLGFGVAAIVLLVVLTVSRLRPVSVVRGPAIVPAEPGP